LNRLQFIMKTLLPAKGCKGKTPQEPRAEDVEDAEVKKEGKVGRESRRAHERAIQITRVRAGFEPSWNRPPL
jgi:hypothetical protein